MELLGHLIHSWDVQAHEFKLTTHLLKVKVEGIYFLTYLYMRGALASLLSERRVERQSKITLPLITDLEPNQLRMRKSK